MEGIKVTINKIGDLLRLLAELVLVVLLGEEAQPERQPEPRPAGGRHSRRGTAPRDWSPLSLDVRRTLAPTYYAGRAA